MRLAELSTTGALRSTRKLARHNGPAHKMALVPGSQHLLFSAGEDGQVLQVDTREQKPDKAYSIIASSHFTTGILEFSISLCAV